MRSWIEFFKERTPLASYILITLGPAVSGYFLASEKQFSAVVLSFIGFFGFFLVLRMMDEYKDYDKDLLAHPKRPLPRGLIALPQFKTGIMIGVFSLFLYADIFFLVGRTSAGILFTVAVIHLWLMYKEFYVGEWLSERPLLYAITHQLNLVTLCLYSLSVFRAQEGFHFSVMDWVYSLSVLFSFFSYEVCRKLDPSAHAVLKTYRAIYGLDGVIAIVGVLGLLHMISIHFLYMGRSLEFLFFIPILLLMSGLFLLRKDKIKFKLVETMATMNLLIFLYSGIFYAISN